MNFSSMEIISIGFTEVLTFSVGLLLSAFIWNTRKTAKRYAGLPTCHKALFSVIFKYLTKRSTSFTSVIFQVLISSSKQFEKEGMFHCWCFRRILVIFGEEASKIFATDEASADKSQDYEVLREGLGLGLTTSNGEIWKKDRKMINPVFHVGMLKGKIPTFNNHAKTLVKDFEKLVDVPSVDILPYIKHIAFINVCESVLGIDVNDEKSAATIQKLFVQVEQIAEYATSRWFFPGTVAKFLKYFTPGGWKSMRLYADARIFGRKLILDIKDSVLSKPKNSDEDLDQNRKSLGHILMEYHLKNPSLTLNHLQDHTYTFAIGGFDTIAYTMMWVLFMLGHHEDVQEKAYNEIQSIVADEYVTYDDVCQMEYLDCIIKESLRLYPTIPVFARHLKKDLQCGKHIVPKNTTIAFFLYRLHRNPEIYPNPEEFDPDRFRSDALKKRKYAFMAFSEGYRNCIGKTFGVIEIKVNLAYILRNFKITSLDRREDLDLTWKVVLTTSKPLRTRLTRRQTTE